MEKKGWCRGVRGNRKEKRRSTKDKSDRQTIDLEDRNDNAFSSELLFSNLNEFIFVMQWSALPFYIFHRTALAVSSLMLTDYN